MKEAAATAGPLRRETPGPVAGRPAIRDRGAGPAKDGFDPADASSDAFLEDARFEFSRLRRLAEAAIAQVPDSAALHHRIPPEGNSIAILMRHLAGNLRSRWTDFLTSDGEKPERHREQEFDARPDLGREALVAEWNAAFGLMESWLARLGAPNLDRTIHIRREPFSVRQAIFRQLVHLAYHTGQIVLLARAASANWESLSMPRGAPPDTAGTYRR